MHLNAQGNYEPWRQPAYGLDASDRGVVPPEGYELVPEGAELQRGDVPFDVYSGWIAPEKKPRNHEKCGYPDLRYNSRAFSSGRWTAWARPTPSNNRYTKQEDSDG